MANSVEPSTGTRLLSTVPPPYADTTPVAPVVLAILDGWGFSPDSPSNAITAAETPVMDALWEAYPHTLIAASGGAVGLPDDQMGNSEVGHLTIGSGRVIRQELVRISQAVRDGSLAETPALNALADTLLANGRTLHLLGLCSAGGVHSHLDHLGGLLRWAAHCVVLDFFVAPVRALIVSGRKGMLMWSKLASRAWRTKLQT